MAVHSEREEENVGQLDARADQADDNQRQARALADVRHHRRLLQEFLFPCLQPQFYHKTEGPPH
jgi:hypothetical protein